MGRKLAALRSAPITTPAAHCLSPRSAHGTLTVRAAACAGSPGDLREHAGARGVGGGSVACPSVRVRRSGGGGASGGRACVPDDAHADAGVVHLQREDQRGEGAAEARGRQSLGERAAKHAVPQGPQRAVAGFKRRRSCHMQQNRAAVRRGTTPVSMQRRGSTAGRLPPRGRCAPHGHRTP